MMLEKIAEHKIAVEENPILWPVISELVRLAHSGYMAAKELSMMSMRLNEARKEMKSQTIRC